MKQLLEVLFKKDEKALGFEVLRAVQEERRLHVERFNQAVENGLIKILAGDKQ